MTAGALDSLRPKIINKNTSTFDPVTSAGRQQLYDGLGSWIPPIILPPGWHGTAILESIYFEEIDAKFSIGCKGKYQIDGDAFVYVHRDTARMDAIPGYPVDLIRQLA